MFYIPIVMHYWWVSLLFTISSPPIITPVSSVQHYSSISSKSPAT